MATAAITDQNVIDVAQRYSIPPAILEGFVRAQGASPTFNLPSATLGAYNLSTTDVQADPLLALEVVARQLTQAFQQYGSWEPALSYTISGDAQAFSSPTSTLGGMVYSILGAASAMPSFGLHGFQPRDVNTFLRTSASFGQHLTSLTHSGGVVTHQSAAGFMQAAGQAAYRADPNLEQMARDVLGRMSQISGQSIQATPANLALIVTMARGEGMPAQDFNWLATTQGQGVGTVPNTPGVQIFGDYQSGIDATARTFLNGNFDAMVQAMRSGTDLPTMANDPNVQANLQKWQGGSNEDVNLLKGAAQSGGPSTVGGTTIVDQLQAAAQNNGQSYSAGQCTWYAARSLGYIPAGLGDAANWASGAAAAGMQVDHTPAVGTAVVWGAGQGGSGPAGHVAVVKAVNPDGTFQVSEMNVDGQYVADERTVTMQGVLGFIHPPQGTDMTAAAPGLNQQVAQSSAAQGHRASADPGAAGAVPAQQSQQRDTPPARQRQIDREEDPAQVAEFATQLQAAGVDPQAFASLFPDFAAQQRMLSGQSVPVTVDEFLGAAQAITQSGQPVNDTTLAAYLRSQPHPTYPGVTQGQVHDAHSSAMLLGVLHTGRVPTVSEAAKFAQSGANFAQMSQYYQAMGQQQAAPAPQVNVPGAQAGAQALADTGAQMSASQPEPAADQRTSGGYIAGL